MTTAHGGEALLLTLLLQLAAILAAARLGAALARRLGQPGVVGEIAAGLALGPSLLGRASPELAARLFVAETDPLLQALGQLGLVFLMFLIGAEFDFRHLAGLRGPAAAVAGAGIALPFALGLALAPVLRAALPEELAAVSPAGFGLFLAITLSITAIPVLGRILVELNLQRTRLAALIISAAAVDDVLGWILLAAVTAAVRGEFELASVGWMLLATALFCLAVFSVARPLLAAFTERSLAARGEPGPATFALLLVAILGSAAASNAIGVFSVFGPFVLGAALSGQPRLARAFSGRMHDVVYVFFLPVFFTYTGLRTDVGLLDSPRLWALAGLVFAAAVAGKIGGCGLAARACGLSWRESGSVAVAMNTRALMGLVAIHVGHELGVVPDSVFSMLVLMALATTFMTSPLLRRLIRGTELEAAYRARPGEGRVA